MQIFCFLYNKNELWKRGNKKAIIFTISSNREEFLGTNLTGEGKNI